MRIDSRLFYEGIEMSNIQSVFFCWKSKTADHLSKEKNLEAVLRKHSLDKNWLLIEHCYRSWSQKLETIKREAKQSRLADRLLFRKTVGRRWSQWRKKFKHCKWLRINYDLAFQYHAEQEMRKYFGWWFGKRAEWNVIYAKKYVLPLQHYRKSLLMSVIGSWKKSWNDSKELKYKLGIMETWRQKQMIRFTIGTWFRLEQDQLFECQRNSGLSSRQLYLGCKYGRRWRQRTLEKLESNTKARKLKENSAAVSIVPLTISNRQRPSPRKPTLIFDTDTNRFRRIADGLPPPVLLPVANLQDNLKSERPNPGLLTFATSLNTKSVEHVSMAHRSSRERRNTPNNSSCVNTSSQTENEASGANSTRIATKSVGTQYELDLDTEAAKVINAGIAIEIVPKGDQIVHPNLDLDFAKRIFEIQSLHKTFMQKKEELMYIEEQLLQYADSGSCLEEFTDLRTLLHSRKALLIEMKEFESVQSDLKEELIRIRAHIASLVKRHGTM
jgi:hypothetical protein